MSMKVTRVLALSLPAVWFAPQAVAFDAAQLQSQRAQALYAQAINAQGGLDDNVLDNLRGGADWQSSDINPNGWVTQNEAANLTTGANFVNGGSFSGSSGFPTVVQNSGNNVLIQNSTIINLQLQ